MPNLIGYDWSPDQFAGDDFITGARGTTYYFSSKSLLYGEENANLTYFGRWAPELHQRRHELRHLPRHPLLLSTCWTTSTKFPLVSSGKRRPATRAKRGIFDRDTTTSCLLEYYGPIVLVKKFIPIDAPESEILTPRTPYDECVKYIAECYDQAAELLPDVVSEYRTGTSDQDGGAQLQGPPAALRRLAAGQRQLPTT
ncbi:MAG: hypothetical protein ACLUGV_05355 [Alistipes shahii]